MKKLFLGKYKLKIIHIIWAIIINAIVPLIFIYKQMINITALRSLLYNVPDLGYGSIAIAFMLLTIGLIKVYIALYTIKSKKAEVGSKYSNKDYNDKIFID